MYFNLLDLYIVLLVRLSKTLDKLLANKLVLTLFRLGFLQIGMARGGGGADSAPLCNFCLDGPIDLKFGM